MQEEVLGDILKKEKKYTNAVICTEMGISDPTLRVLLKNDIAEIKPYASVLAKVQDFNKAHINDINYAGIPSTDPGPDGEDKPDREIKSPERKPYTERKTSEPQGQDCNLNPLIELIKLIPDNVTISITINGDKA